MILLDQFTCSEIEVWRGIEVAHLITAHHFQVVFGLSMKILDKECSGSRQERTQQFSSDHLMTSPRWPAVVSHITGRYGILVSQGYVPVQHYRVAQ